MGRDKEALTHFVACFRSQIIGLVVEILARLSLGRDSERSPSAGLL
jgi:hypothetical protein